jgi:hypothetical protein
MKLEVEEEKHRLEEKTREKYRKTCLDVDEAACLLRLAKKKYTIHRQ